MNGSDNISRELLYKEATQVTQRSQNHLREQMDPTLKSLIAWLIHLLTQVDLTSLPKLSGFLKEGREQIDQHSSRSLRG